MVELLRSNDAVILSFSHSLLQDAGIVCFIADYHSSLVDGSLGLLPRRLMVDKKLIDEARRILIDAGLEQELRGNHDQ